MTLYIALAGLVWLFGANLTLLMVAHRQYLDFHTLYNTTIEEEILEILEEPGICLLIIFIWPIMFVILLIFYMAEFAITMYSHLPKLSIYKLPFLLTEAVIKKLSKEQNHE